MNFQEADGGTKRKADVDNICKVTIMKKKTLSILLTAMLATAMVLGGCGGTEDVSAVEYSEESVEVVAESSTESEEAPVEESETESEVAEESESQAEESVEEESEEESESETQPEETEESSIEEESTEVEESEETSLEEEEEAESSEASVVETPAPAEPTNPDPAPAPAENQECQHEWVYDWRITTPSYDGNGKHIGDHYKIVTICSKCGYIKDVLGEGDDMFTDTEDAFQEAEDTGITFLD